jgi:hypothetical protein
MVESKMENRTDSGQSESPLAVKLGRDVGAELKDEGRRLMEDAKASALQLAAERRDMATAYVSALASAARSGASELEQSGYTRSAGTITRASHDVQGLAEDLSKRSPTSLLSDLEDFARERPVLTFSLAFAAAFGATRFLRTSEEEAPDAGDEVAGTAKDAAQATTPAKPGGKGDRQAAAGAGTQE